MESSEQITSDLNTPIYLAPASSNEQAKQPQLRLLLSNDGSQCNAQVDQFGTSQGVTFLQITDDSFAQNGGQVQQIYQIVPQSFENQQVVISQQDSSSKSAPTSSSNSAVAALTPLESVTSLPVNGGQVSLIENNGQQYLILPNFTTLSANQQIVIQNQGACDQSHISTTLTTRELAPVTSTLTVNVPSTLMSQTFNDGSNVARTSSEKQNIHGNSGPVILPRPPTVLKFHDTTQKESGTSTVTSDKVEMLDLIPSFFTRTVVQQSEIAASKGCLHCKFNAKTLEELEAHVAQHKNNPAPSLTSATSSEKKKMESGKKKKPGKTKKAQIIRTEPAASSVDTTFPSTCPVCHADIKTAAQYRKHQKLHKNDKPHRCDECGESFNKEHNLNLHQSIHKKMKSNSGHDKYECPECKRVFSRMAGLKMHIFMHAEEESFICKECGDEFACNEDLEAHVTDHNIDLARHLHDKVKGVSLILHPVDDSSTQGSAITVNIEDLPDNYDDSLAQIQDLTEDNTPQSQKSPVMPQITSRPATGSHLCRFCGKNFQKKFQLLRHMLIHTGEKPHKCTTCEKSFNQKSALQKHMSLHSGEKPFSCPHCPQMYRQRGNLNLHIRRVHLLPDDGQKKFGCKDCQCIFRKIGSLNAHVTKYHTQRSFEVEIGVEDSGNAQNLAVSKQATGTTLNPDQQMTDIVNQAMEACVGATSENAMTAQTEAENNAVALQEMSLQIDGNQMDEPPQPNNAQFQQLVNHEAETSTSVPGSRQPDTVAGAATRDSRPVLLLHEGSPSMTGTNDALPFTNAGSISPEPGTPTGVTELEFGGEQRRVTLEGPGQSESNLPSQPLIIGDMRRTKFVKGVRYHECTYCCKAFRKPSDLTRHIRIHTLERPYNCRQCGRTFTVKSSLTSHIRSHLGIKPHRCQICQKCFTTGSSLKIHQRLHTGAKPFQCPYCEKRFRTTGHRSNHMCSHFKRNAKSQVARIKKKPSSDFSHVQLLSPLIISSNGEVTFHKNKDPNTGVNRGFSCEMCGKSFARPFYLKQHMRLHTGERPFECQRCKKRFTSKACLKAHLRTHSGLNNYTCESCGQHFNTKGSLTRHALTHSKERPFMCPYCRRMFKSPSTCQKHIRTHREEVALLQYDTTGEPQTSSSAGANETNVLSAVLGNESTISDLPTMEDTLNNSYMGNIQGAENMADSNLTQVNPNMVQNLSNLTLPANVGSLRSQQTFLFSPTGRQNLGGQISQQPTDPNAQQLSLEELASLTVPQDQTPNQTDLSLFDLEMPPTPGGGLTLSVGQPLYVDNLTFLETITSGTSQSFPTTHDATVSHNATVPENDFFPNHQDTTLTNKQTTIVLEAPKTQPRGKYYGGRLIKVSRHNMYQCMGCEAVFSPEDFEDHSESYEQMKKEMPFDCDLCCHRFPSQPQYTSHVKFHSIESGLVYKCSKCGIGFDSKSIQDEHQNAHLESVQKKDQKMGMKLSASSGARVSPYATKSRSNYIRLTDEQNKILAQTNPNLHMTVSERILLSAVAEKDRIVEKVTGTRGRFKPLETDGPKHKCACPHCPKSFRKQTDLTRHIRTHTGEKPFSCRHCGKNFSIKSYLTIHEKAHSGIKEFRCHICDLMYSSRASLKVHMRLHTGSLPYKCPHCPKCFRTSGHRMTHIRSHIRRNKIANDKEKVQVSALPQNAPSNNLLVSDLTLTLPEGILQGSEGLQLQWNGQTVQLVNGSTTPKDGSENVTLQIDPVSLQQALSNITSTASLDSIRNYTRPVTTGPSPNLVIQPITLPESMIRDLSNGSGTPEVNVAVPASLASLTQMLFQVANSASSTQSIVTTSLTQSSVVASEKRNAFEKDITLSANADDLANQELQPFSFELLSAEDIQPSSNQPFS